MSKLKPFQMIESFQYFCIDPKRKEYKGIRYFKFNINSEYVIQVCLSNGEMKKGRGAALGIFTMQRLSFLSNYLMMAYAIPCSKQEYDKNFKLALKLLK